MKFLSMSLIAAAIASIAGSAIAAPGLNAPSLEQVNLERDLDVYPRVAVQERDVLDNSNHDRDDLFTRSVQHMDPQSVNHQDDHHRAARQVAIAIQANNGAACVAHVAHVLLKDPDDKQRWEDMRNMHRAMAQVLSRTHADQLSFANLPDRTDAHTMVDHIREHARSSIQSAVETTEQARHAIHQEFLNRRASRAAQAHVHL